MASVRLKHYYGTTFFRSFTFLVDRTIPFNLTGAKIWFSILNDLEEVVDTLYWEMGLGNGISVPNPISGIAFFDRTAEQMSELAPGTYLWYLRIQEESGINRVVEHGYLDILDAVYPPTP